MFHGNPVKLPHMTLSLAPKVFDPIDMIFLLAKTFGVINAVVFGFLHQG